MNKWNKIEPSVYSIIYVKEDDKGNVKYYTTTDDFDHSWLCEIPFTSLKELSEKEVLQYDR